MKLFRRFSARKETAPIVLGGARRAELRDHGLAGVELKVCRGNDLPNGPVSFPPEAAVEASALRRQQTLQKGWRDEESS